MSRFVWLIPIVVQLFFVSSVAASTYLSVGDEVYESLIRLEANGMIQSGLLTTQPLSRREVLRLILEAMENSEGGSPFSRHEVELLRDRFKDELADVKYIKPLDEINIDYIHSDREPAELVYNNDGDEYRKDSNYRLGVTSRGDLGWLSFHLDPEIRHSDDDTDIIMQKAYAVLGFAGVEFEFGKDSQWWGPGHHGSLLLSNNAEPFTMLRFTNPQPTLLPWIFRPLGLFRVTGFVTKLEKKRAVPEPFLWGLRLNFKPTPYLEIGIQRTALLGGEGRSDDLATWWKSFTGKSENSPGVQEEAGDQRAGYDIKLTLPFHRQPFQIYLEADGEDMAGSLPGKWAYLTGLYLPRILSLEKVDFRAEYSATHMNKHPGAIWYEHGIYSSGYRYKDRIIGHHQGTDSRDLFFEMNYRLPRRIGRVKISFDKEKHNLSGSPNPSKVEASLGIKIDLKKKVSIEGIYTAGKLKNAANSGSRNINLFIMKLKYLL